MTGQALLCALFLAAPALAAAPEEEGEYKPETWHSFSMEAAAIVGELQYQDRDYAGAKANFSESLDSSMKVTDPNAPFVALDLYRTAEFAMREKDYDRARRHLQILVHRYPDSEWAARGRRLLAALSKGLESEEEPAEETSAPRREAPEEALDRLQAALRGRRHALALALSTLFLRAHPSHPSAAEVRLARAALLVRRGSFDDALPELRSVARGTDAALRSRAAYLLGGVHFAVGDLASLRDAVSDAPAPSDRWALLSQAWRAAADDAEGRPGDALPRWRRAASAGPSPLHANILASAAADEDALGRPDAAALGLRDAALEAERAALPALAAAARLSCAHALARARRWKDSAEAYADFAERYRSHGERAQSFYLQGLMWRRAERPKEAAKAFATMLKEHPESRRASDAHLQLGLLRADGGDMDRAVEHFERMAKAPGSTPERAKESMLLIAQVHYNAKRWTKAIDLYRFFLAKWPDDPRRPQVEELLLTSGWMNGDRTDPTFLAELDRRPAPPVAARIRWELGKEALSRADCAAVLLHLGRLCEDFPGDRNVPEALMRRAECFEKGGRGVEASALWKEVSEKFPSDPLAREASFRLGNALLGAGDLQGSESVYKKVAAGGDALAADALYNRALALSKAGKREETLSAFEELLARFPKYPRAQRTWLEVGALREELQRFAPAAEAYAKVREEGLSARALFGLGRCREHLKQRPLAREAYEGLHTVRPSTEPLRLNGLMRLGLLYEMEDLPLKAMPVYAELVRLAADPALKKSALERLQDLTSRKAYQQPAKTPAAGSPPKKSAGERGKKAPAKKASGKAAPRR